MDRMDSQFKKAVDSISPQARWVLPDPYAELTADDQQLLWDIVTKISEHKIIRDRNVIVED